MTPTGGPPTGPGAARTSDSKKPNPNDGDAASIERLRASESFFACFRDEQQALVPRLHELQRASDEALRRCEADPMSEYEFGHINGIPVGTLFDTRKRVQLTALNQRDT